MSGSHIVAAGVFRRPAKCRRDRHSPMGWLDGALAFCALALETDRLVRNKRRLRRLPPKPNSLHPSSRYLKPNSLRIRRRLRFLPQNPSSPHLSSPVSDACYRNQASFAPGTLRPRRLPPKPSTLRPKRPLLKLSSLHLSNHRLRHPPPNPRSPLSRHLRRRRLPPKLSSPRLRHHRLKLSSRRHPALANKSTRAQPAAWTPMPGCRICWPITSFFASSLNWISCRPNRHSSTAAF
jgi:hypothetical protein